MNRQAAIETLQTQMRHFSQHDVMLMASWVMSIPDHYPFTGAELQANGTVRVFLDHNTHETEVDPSKGELYLDVYPEGFAMVYYRNPGNQGVLHFCSFDRYPLLHLPTMWSWLERIKHELSEPFRRGGVY